MLLRTKGIAKNIDEPIVTRVTRMSHKANEPNYVLIAENGHEKSDTFLLTSKKEVDKSFKGIFSVSTFDHLQEDDIVLMGEDGNLRTLYRINSFHNSLLATERCNSNCLMCSQPPMDRDDIPYIHNAHKKLIPLIPKNCPELGITGGEPTILGDRFFELLEIIKQELPDTEVHILTNGRSFSQNALAEKLGYMNYSRVMLGIPVYSDYYQVHDHVVQAKHAFYQTIMGIHNLKRYNVRVEIRVVLHKIVIPRLVKLAHYIYKNLSFVDHVAFMGLEMMGYTKANINKLWIDPTDYMDELGEAVTFLASKRMHVSIYNTPLCLLPVDLWSWSRKSISDWKNIYFDECTRCAVLEKCGGLFASATFKHSEKIKAFADDPTLTEDKNQQPTAAKIT